MQVDAAKMQAVLSWDDVRFFLALARHGTHARAARELRVDATTVSRRLSALEQALEAALCERSPAGLKLTAAGHALLAQAERMEQALFEGERSLRAQNTQVRGELSITAGDAVVHYLLVPWLGELRRAYPGLRLTLNADNRALDLARREADLALRFVRPKAAGLVVKRAASMAFGVFAAPSYLERTPAPRTLAELRAHDWLTWDARLADSPQTRWLARHVPEARSVSCINTTTSLVAACALGHGLALLPLFAAEHDARLQRVLPEAPALARDLWIVTHAQTRRSAAIRVLVTWLTRRFTERFARDASRL